MTPGRWLRRVPLRIKLTAIYALVATVALAGVGAFLFLRFESELNRTIDADLRSRSQALAALVGQQGPAVLDTLTARRLLRPQGGVAQLVDRRSGRVVRASPALAAVRLLDRSDAARVGSSGVQFTRTAVPGVAKRARFSAQLSRSGSLVVVVGRSLSDREGANESFARALLISGPLALILASIAAYGLTTAALRPVELMRRRAATISAADAHARLPVPEADDEIRRLGRTLNQMLARLEGAFAQQRALTADASHELRTPLAVLISRLEIALRRERPAAELREILQETLTEAQRLSRLADGLLLLARLDEEPLDVTRAAVDVDELVAGVLARYADSPRPVTSDPTGLTVHADASRIEQALANLVDNALIHGRGPVVVTVVRGEAETEFHVTDDGDGIPADFAGRAFDRFSRHPAARTRPGSGLGLAIVAAIAAAHHGRAGAGASPRSDVWFTVADPDRPAGAG